MRWAEHGGPPAQTPTRRGFGLTVIERSLAYELGGSGRLEFHPARAVLHHPVPAEHIVPALLSGVGGGVCRRPRRPPPLAFPQSGKGSEAKMVAQSARPEGRRA